MLKKELFCFILVLVLIPFVIAENSCESASSYTATKKHTLEIPLSTDTPQQICAYNRIKDAPDPLNNEEVTIWGLKENNPYRTISPIQKKDKLIVSVLADASVTSAGALNLHDFYAFDKNSIGGHYIYSQSSEISHPPSTKSPIMSLSYSILPGLNCYNPEFDEEKDKTISIWGELVNGVVAFNNLDEVNKGFSDGKGTCSNFVSLVKNTNNDSVLVNQCPLDGSDCWVFQNKNKIQGKCIDNQCAVSLNVGLDPKYIRDTERDRLFTPKEITPFDDIVCELKVVDTKNMPNSLGAIAELKTKNPSGGDIQIALQVPLKLSRMKEEAGINYIIYQVKFKGWSNNQQGWTFNRETMEALVKSGLARCDISTMSYQNPIFNEAFSTSNCVHLWGKDKQTFKMINMRGESAGFSSNEIVQRGKENYEEGFHKVDPFKTYKEDFAFYADLVNYLDSDWSLRIGYENKQRGYFYEGMDTGLRRAIAYSNGCKSIFSDMTAFYTRRGTPSDDYAYINMDGGVAYLGKIVSPLTAVHEQGHAFCRLADEYVYPWAKNQNFPNPQMNSNRGISGRVRANCRLDGKEFLPWGDSFYKNCSIKELFRPSVNSIMNEEITGKFNVISCGYCLKKIKANQPITKAWEECMTLDTIKPKDECLTDNHCSENDSYGCSECKNRKCVPVNEGADCYAEKTIDFVMGSPVKEKKWGSCSEGVCKLNQYYKCVVKNGESLGCKDNERCDPEAHECVLK